MADRYAPVRQIAVSNGVDAIALVPGANFSRLFNAEFHQNERPLVVVVPATGKPSAVVPSLEIDLFTHLNFEGDIFDWRDQDGYQSAFDSMLATADIRSLGVEGQNMRVFIERAFRQSSGNLDIVDLQREISSVRLKKTEPELSAMRQAIAMTEAALQNAVDQVAIGMSERDVEKILLQHLYAQGADEMAFSPIVAASTQSALPHAHSRKDYLLQAGDALLIDLGVRSDGLCSDITRTFFVDHCTDDQQAVYETVLEANKAGHLAAHPGATAHQVDDAALTVLENSAYADRILHKTGHGLGREVHEDPYIMRGNHQTLEAGMVFTIEPGLYKVGEFGVRIEDDVLISSDGSESLTRFEKKLTIIGRG